MHRLDGNLFRRRSRDFHGADLQWQDQHPRGWSLLPRSSQPLRPRVLRPLAGPKHDLHSLFCNRPTLLNVTTHSLAITNTALLNLLAGFVILRHPKEDFDLVEPQPTPIHGPGRRIFRGKGVVLAERGRRYLDLFEQNGWIAKHSLRWVRIILGRTTWWLGVLKSIKVGKSSGLKSRSLNWRRSSAPKAHHST